MTLYELSSDAAAVREGERIVSLEGRGFPTLVMRWDSRLFDQSWVTTIVLDYLIALPPLVTGQAKFNEVRLAALVAGAPTKFLYFGTELTANVPRVAPEMENLIGPAGIFQEFRLEEHTCPVPYLKLIQTTPRIYGNGAQDYYSPPIKVERYDGAAGPDHIADLFPMVVANLDSVSGSVLNDPAKGFWKGARYVGTDAIAIKRQGKVVGLHKRVGRAEKEPLPPSVKLREPSLDARQGWVAVDFGASSTVVAIRSDRGPAELVSVGATTAPLRSRDYENPTEIAFEHLGRTMKAWRERIVLPMTRWEDVVVGHAARDRRERAGEDRALQTAASVTELPLLRERTERKEAFRLRGASDPETTEALRKPAPPIIDEDGIGAHDPFDPIELYAYYVGLHVNQRSRGLYTRYAVTMPAGFSHERRESVLVAFRRGFYRSLPAGFVAYDDLHKLEVVDAGPTALAFAVQAFRAFGIQAKGALVPFFIIDAGASETGLLGGIYRDAKPHEKGDGADRVVEYMQPSSLASFGAERILHRMAYRAYLANEAMLRERHVPFEVPEGEAPMDGAGELLAPSPEARANTRILKDVVRPLLEVGPDAKLSSLVRLLSTDGRASDVRLELESDAIAAVAAASVKEAIVEVWCSLGELVAKIGRAPDPYEGLHVFLAGRLGMNAAFADGLAAELPANVKLHRFVEPGSTNLSAPTVKTATALGVLSMRFDKVHARRREESRDTFRYRVGKSRHGEFSDVLDPSVEYDAWREMGACSKPDVELLFMAATDTSDLAADDPRLTRAVCSLGAGAVGQRVYVRAVGPARVEVSSGPPDGEPSSGAPRWTVDLAAGTAKPAA